MTRRRAVWLTLLAYVLLLFGALVGTASLLAAGGLIWLVAISETQPTGLLYVPIFVWLASNMGLGAVTVGLYRIGIRRAFTAGEVEHAIRLSEVSPFVSFGAIVDIYVGELPATASVRWINNGASGRLGYIAVACILVAVVLDRL